ncbi:MAG TPA: FAD-dependent oxidoreductase, partial [Burkholderiaceae bacterium]
MPVLVVGAGPVGLTAALDLAQRGVQVVLIDDNDQVAIGSRAVCWAQRTLEIWDRLGIGEEIAARGVRWQVGRVFHGESLAYHFDLAEEGGSKMPPFVNLQQNLVEQMLVEACMKEPLIELRWKHRLVGLHQAGDHVRAEIEAPEGKVMLEADWLLACDGAKSDTRKLLGLTFEGQVFPDRFLIADVRMQGDFPAERWFWFDPPFHPGQSVLLHKQAEDLWRIDFQLGRDADAELEKRPERVLPRIRAMLGPEARFELDWVSVYQFACRRLEKFRHGRVFFVGDSAHQVSPFGARGANSGVQDADNLGWKLAAVLQGTAPESLLDSYHAERAAAA